MPPSAMDLSVIVLTYNEELHIRRCLDRLAGVAREVFVVDCFSSDGTVATAEALGARVVQHAWPGNQAAQVNWALANLPIQGAWVLRLDADEYLSAALIDEMRARLDGLAPDVTGVELKLRRLFLGRVIRHGMPKVMLLRLFRNGKAQCETRLMDEHLALLQGRAVTFAGEFADDSLRDIGWWTAKHNEYALREAASMLDLEYGILGLASGSGGGGLSRQARAKRRSKERYARLPLFGRAFGYFLLRYLFLGGFLDGKEGFLWHFLQGWWYRTLVDAKIQEIKRQCGGDPAKIVDLLRNRYGMSI